MGLTGRVVRVNGPLVEIEGLERAEMLELVTVGERRLPAEIVSIASGLVTAQAYEPMSGVRTGDTAAATGYALSAWLGPDLLGGTFDGLLRPLAGRADFLGAAALAQPGGERRWAFEPLAGVGDAVAPGALLGRITNAGPIEHRVLVPPGVAGRIETLAAAGPAGDRPIATIGGRDVGVHERWPIRTPRPSAGRLANDAPLLTGQRVLDLFFPLAKGATAAVPGGFGTGKTMLLQQIVKWCDADVIVFVGCGERGNELADAMADLRELGDRTSGHSLLERTVVIANTSNMPVMAREASIYTGMTVAEYYRDMGYDTVLLADSTSRWAEALREFSSRSGELPAEEGYPAGLSSALAAFYERAGRVTTLGGRTGSVSAIGAVSPPGGDMTEPVTAHTERFVRSLWSLDRTLAYARHYPAVTWRRSFSRDVEAVAAWHEAAGRPNWNRARARAVTLLAEADRLESVVELVGLTGLPGDERVAILAGRLLREAVLQQNALSANDAACGANKQSALLELVLALHAACLALNARGVPSAVIEEFDFSRVARLRDELGPDDAAAVATVQAELLARLETLS